MADGKPEVRRLDPSERGEAVGPQPLLADHLHLQRVPRGGLPDRRRPFAATRPRLGEAQAAEYRREDHDHGCDDQPGELDAIVAADRGPFLWLASALAKGE